MVASKVNLYPFQLRVLRCLLNRPYFIKDLNNASKQQHSPNAVKALREVGIKVISTFKDNPDPLAVTRRQIVEYSIDPDCREYAHEVARHHRKA